MICHGSFTTLLPDSAFLNFFFPNLNLEVATQPYYQLSFEHKGQKKSHILCSLLLY